ncbi:MAG: hypothetical protein ACI4SA_09580 [Lachnospiraceae bacterium]
MAVLVHATNVICVADVFHITIATFVGGIDSWSNWSAERCVYE